MDTMKFPESVKKLLDPEDDALWREWVDLASRTHADLRALVDDDIFRPGMRARALVVSLWKFDHDQCPVYWPGNEYDFNFNILGGLDDKYWLLAGDLVCWGADAARDLPESSGDVRSAWRKSDFITFYQSCIRQMLMRKGEPVMSERLFSRYELLEPRPYEGIDDSSSYEPFMMLLWEPAIDQRWKDLADCEMRVRITDELSGKARPREPWEDALQCYAEAVNLLVNDERRLSYSFDLLALQVEFIAKHMRHRPKQALIRPYKLRQIYKLLQLEPAWAHVRKALTEAVVLHPKEPVSVHCESTLTVAELMLAEWGEQCDDQVATALKAMIAAGKAKVDAFRAKRSRDAQREQELFIKMRR